MQFFLFQLHSDFAIIRQGQRDQIPKLARVVEFSEMAKFVNNNIVAKRRWQKSDPIIEIQIPLSRATAPTHLLVADGYSPDFENIAVSSINRNEKLNPLSHQNSCQLFVFQIIFLRDFARSSPDSPSSQTKRISEQSDLFFHYLFYLENFSIPRGATLTDSFYESIFYQTRQGLLYRSKRNIGFVLHFRHA